MEKVLPKRTHALPVELRFRAIPTTWKPGLNGDGERILFPAVSQNGKRRLATVSDPEEIRTQFFKLKPNEESTLDFLNSVGLWDAVEDRRGLTETDPRIRAMRFQGTFGHRHLNGRAVVATVEYMQDWQRYWRGLYGGGNRAKLKAAFGPAPSSESPIAQKTFFWSVGRHCNTLPVHLEWRGKHPHAVIQPVTGLELLAALAWMDLVNDAVVKVCQNSNCEIEYTHGRSKFCSYECERANTKRAYRHRVKQAEWVVKANLDHTIPVIAAKLAEAGIERERAWVTSARARLEPAGRSRAEGS